MTQPAMSEGQPEREKKKNGQREFPFLRSLEKVRLPPLLEATWIPGTTRDLRRTKEDRREATRNNKVLGVVSRGTQREAG